MVGREALQCFSVGQTHPNCPPYLRQRVQDEVVALQGLLVENSQRRLDRVLYLLQRAVTVDVSPAPQQLRAPRTAGKFGTPAGLCQLEVTSGRTAVSCRDAVPNQMPRVGDRKQPQRRQILLRILTRTPLAQCTASMSCMSVSVNISIIMRLYLCIMTHLSEHSVLQLV